MGAPTYIVVGDGGNREGHALGCGCPSTRMNIWNWLHGETNGPTVAALLVFPPVGLCRRRYHTPQPAWNAYANDTQFGHGTITVPNATHLHWCACVKKRAPPPPPPDARLPVAPLKLFHPHPLRCLPRFFLGGGGAARTLLWLFFPVRSLLQSPP